MKRVILSFFIQVNIYAAACCGGSSAIPSLITGDNNSQFSLSQSMGTVVGRTYEKNRNVFYTDNKEYKTFTTSLKGAHLITPLFQVGAGVSLVSKDNRDGTTKETKTLLGDTDLSLAYEYLPETFYSVWKPRGFVYLKHIFPTGKSNFETDTRLLTDVSGKGQHISSLGFVFTKIFRSIDWQIYNEFKYLHQESISNKEISHSYGDTQGLSFGYSPNNGAIRTQLGLSRHHFQEKDILINNVNQVSNREEYYDFEVGLNYMINDSTYSLTYSDQTIFGPTENTTLSRTISISWLERWPL
ncbi:hypothetical protein [Halobacteriovorax marinus]|uniref:hypothetical protein n=2 Tax=Halobacteriovorax marinus TaxID=97084 RepID=UPI003A952B71